jgi:tRNA (guanine-N7-)-methyltransferase
MQTNHELIVEPIGLDPDALPKPLDWATLYGNANPVETRDRHGQGHVSSPSRPRPGRTSTSSDRMGPLVLAYASDRLRRNKCLNARTVRAEASFFLTEFVPPESLSVLHIYFPDPWPKARHHKRRLIQEKFIPVAHRALKPGGRIQVVTDHQGYWEENIEPVIRAAKGFEVVDYNRPGSASEGEFVGTNFERKYRREGRPFYAIAAVRG